MNNSLVSALYVVATPIGCLTDISARALEVLRSVDRIACEDTRHTQQLLRHYGIQCRLESLHAHNEAQAIPRWIARLQDKQSIALVSDAGTPLISDPGAGLVAACHQHGIQVVPIPGPCAAVAALSVAGLMQSEFVFLGFLSSKRAARCQSLAAIEHEMRPVVCYEAPHRIVALLQDILACLGPDRPVMLARELTKSFETIRHGSVAELLAWVEQDKNQQRGEIVVVIDGAKQPRDPISHAREVWQILASKMTHRDAVAATVAITGVAKNQIYSWKADDSST